MVVWSILVVESITRLGPIIFLKLAEKTTGQYDAAYSYGFGYESEGFLDYDQTDGNNGTFIDYAAATAQLQKAGIDANIAPRRQFTESYLHDGTTYLTVNVGWIDTEKEKAIGIGEDYPFDAMKAGECLIPAALNTKN